MRNSPIYTIDMEFCDRTLEEYIRYIHIAMAQLADNDNDDHISENRYAQFWYSVCTVMLHILSGLAFIHKCNEVHRDLKPANGMSSQILW